MDENKATPMTFSELKKLVNSLDESRWGDRIVYAALANSVGEDRPLVGFSTTSGLPASPEGSAAAKWYGVHDAIPPRIILEWMGR